MGQSCIRFLKAVFLAGVFATSAAAQSASPAPPRAEVPYKAVGDYFAVLDGDRYRPIFLKGVDLAVGVPGTQPGELAATADQYHRWLEIMWDGGINVVRVYTLHFPRFYEVLDEFNRSHVERPIYLLQGVWLDDDGTPRDLYDLSSQYDDRIQEVIDAVHGHREIARRPGGAYGVYDADASRWVIGWLLGREVHPNEVLKTNRAHPNVTSFGGASFRLPSGSASEAWWAEQLDRCVEYERRAYSTERPVGAVNWPTLDPLSHPTEPASTQEDVASIDLANLEAVHAPAGYFVGYHLYPNYPDFINEQPSYQSTTDSLGPNSYLAYLSELKQHYRNVPLIAAEFGVPTSWGNARIVRSGMNDGGLDEHMQGVYTARMIDNLHASRYAGAVVFAWMDEWWKATWIVTPQTFPIARYRLWHNVMSPEQNYGLIAWDLPAPSYDRWPEVKGTGQIAAVAADANPEFFFLKIRLNRAVLPDERVVIGFDTYADDRGERVLPNGVRGTRRHEIALDITGWTSAQVMVTTAYDLYGIAPGKRPWGQPYRSLATDGKGWVPVRWVNRSRRISSDGSVRPPIAFEAGKLRIRRAADPASTLDAVVIDGDTVTVRMPWMLLQFTDPSRLEVMDDDPKVKGDSRQTTVSEGIAVAVSAGGDLLETPRFRWSDWESVPPTTIRLKSGVPAIWQAFRACEPLP